MSAAADAAAPLADVAGKVAFVTGGSSGVGLGMARAFLAAGMKVAFTWRRSAHRDEALALLGADAAVHAIELDVTDRTAFARAADEAERVFGRVHLLACNAGVGIRAGAAEASFNDWDWGLGVNLGGVVNGIATLLPRMRAHGEGAHVLATASVAGLAVGGRLGVYATAKFAVVGLMESLREELADQHVGVSVFCPGFVRSNLVETERLRPARFANEAAKASTTAYSAQEEAVFRKLMVLGLDPLAAGERVLDGVRRNELYILTHAEFAPLVRARMDALMASFPRDGAPRGRAEAAKKFMADIYVRERARRE